MPISGATNTRKLRNSPNSANFNVISVPSSHQEQCLEYLSTVPSQPCIKPIFNGTCKRYSAIDTETQGGHHQGSTWKSDSRFICDSDTRGSSVSISKFLTQFSVLAQSDLHYIFLIREIISGPTCSSVWHQWFLLRVRAMVPNGLHIADKFILIIARWGVGKYMRMSDDETVQIL